LFPDKSKLLYAMRARCDVSGRWRGKPRVGYDATLAFG